MCCGRRRKMSFQICLLLLLWLAWVQRWRHSVMLVLLAADSDTNTNQHQYFQSKSKQYCSTISVHICSDVALIFASSMPLPHTNIPHLSSAHPLVPTLSPSIPLFLSGIVNTQTKYISFLFSAVDDLLTGDIAITAIIDEHGLLLLYDDILTYGPFSLHAKRLDFRFFLLLSFFFFIFIHFVPLSRCATDCLMGWIKSLISNMPSNTYK